MSTNERTLIPLLPVKERRFGDGYYYHSNHDPDSIGLKWFQSFKQFLEKSVGQTIIQVQTEGPKGFRVLLEPRYTVHSEAAAAADKLIQWLQHGDPDRIEKFMQMYGLTEEQFNGPLQNETPGTEAPRASTENPFPVANCEERLSEPGALSSSADKLQQKMRPLVLRTIDTEGDYERAKGWLRYEVLRAMDIRRFTELVNRNVAGENFDEMVDQIIVEREGL